MKKENFRSRVWLAALLSLIFIASSTEAFAYERSGDRHSQRVVVSSGRQQYHFRQERFYGPSFFNFGIFFGRPRMGAVVYDNVYYRECPAGYVVVPAPTVNVYAQAEPERETVTIYVPNIRGGYTPITLVKRANGYYGPQGEYYPSHPTVEQLRALYGN